MTRIVQVTVTVEFDNGEKYTLREAKPHPQGDNPRFLGQQLDTAMGALSERTHLFVETMYGEQIPKAAPAAHLQSTESAPAQQYRQRPTTGMVHAAECHQVTASPAAFIEYDPSKATHRASAGVAHAKCLPDGLPEPT